MKPYYRLAALLLLLSLPLPGYSFDLESTLRGMALVLLAVLAGLAAIVAALVATSKLLVRLQEPEATDPVQRRTDALHIAGLTLPATAVAWGIMAWLTYDPHGSWYYPAVPITLLLGLVVGLLLRWRRRPMAATGLLSGLLVAGGLTSTIYWLRRVAPKPPVPIALGLLGNPVFQEASLPAASVEAADTSHVYTDVEQMPGFRGTGKALKSQANAALHYPTLARDHGVTGIVQVTFTVPPTGGITSLRVTYSLSPECDAEAVRVTKLLAPGFSPGSQNGRPVPVQETLSFGFGPSSTVL